MPISWNTLIFKFHLIFATNDRRIVYREWPFICPFSTFDADQWASQKHHMKGLSQCNSTLIGCKNQANCENDCVSRNGDRIKFTQQNLLILVSFSSAEDALFNDVQKKCDTFSLQGTENLPSRFFGGTPGTCSSHCIQFLYWIEIYQMCFNTFYYYNNCITSTAHIKFSLSLISVTEFSGCITEISPHETNPS